MARATVKFFFSSDVREFKQLILSLLSIIERQFEVEFKEADSDLNAQLNFGSSAYPLNQKIYSDLKLSKACDESYLKGLNVYFTEERKDIDPLASIFYVLHCLSEKSVSKNDRDNYDRISYEKSIYKKFHSTSEDIVSPLIRLFLNRYCSLENVHLITRKQVILTHDIDFLTSGFKQELAYFFRKPSFQLAKHLVRHLTGKKKVWNNLDEIVYIERSFGFKSTFYLLPVEGSHNNISNADYGSKILKKTADRLRGLGMEVGLHKSSANLSYEEEMSRFQMSFVKTNRNHFLSYNLPDDWSKIASAGIQVDTGLGWTDEPGLRNGYPFSFKPYGTGSAIIVVPLVLMDTTFDNRGKTGLVQTFKQMAEEWKDGFIVSILFHNNFLTPWSNKYFLEEYKALLTYLHSGNIEVISPAHLVHEDLNTKE